MLKLLRKASSKELFFLLPLGIITLSGPALAGTAGQEILSCFRPAASYVSEYIDENGQYYSKDRITEYEGFIRYRHWMANGTLTMRFGILVNRAGRKKVVIYEDNGPVPPDSSCYLHYWTD
jgi:hypothetical protein